MKNLACNTMRLAVFMAAAETFIAAFRFFLFFIFRLFFHILIIPFLITVAIKNPFRIIKLLHPQGEPKTSYVRIYYKGLLEFSSQNLQTAQNPCCYTSYFYNLSGHLSGMKIYSSFYFSCVKSPYTASS